MTHGGRETLVCDSSLVGHLNRRNLNPRRYAGWEVEGLTRIDEALLVVSVVTVAEARAGYIGAGWGGRRLMAAEWELRRFRWLPLDRAHVDEWARLQVAARNRGIALSDNDLWIAATASVGEGVLVTCDRDHQRIAPEMPVEVVFLAPPV